MAFNVITLAVCYYGTTYIEKEINKTYSANINHVQQGFVVPSQLEIKVKDLDQNGENETYMTIGEKTYALKYVDGKPRLLEYQVTFYSEQNQTIVDYK